MSSDVKTVDRVQAAIDLLIAEKNFYKAEVERQDRRIAELEQMLKIKGLLII